MKLTIMMILALVCLNCAQGPDKSEAPAAEEIPAAQAVAEDPDFIEKPMHTTKIESITKTDSLVTFNVNVQTPNPCWKFARYEVEKKDGEIFVTVIARKKKDEMCIQIIGSLAAEIPVAIDQPGEYACRFWCQNSATLDTTITVQ